MLIKEIPEILFGEFVEKQITSTSDGRKFAPVKGVSSLFIGVQEDEHSSQLFLTQSKTCVVHHYYGGYELQVWCGSFGWGPWDDKKGQQMVGKISVELDCDLLNCPPVVRDVLNRLYELAHLPNWTKNYLNTGHTLGSTESFFMVESFPYGWAFKVVAN